MGFFSLESQWVAGEQIEAQTVDIIIPGEGVSS